MIGKIEQLSLNPSYKEIKREAPKEKTTLHLLVRGSSGEQIEVKVVNDWVYYRNGNNWELGEIL